MRPRLVILESPFNGPCGEHRRHDPACRKCRSVRVYCKLYLDLAMRDSIARGEAPFASHGLYPLFLDEDTPEGRALGITLGHAWLGGCEAVVVYADGPGGITAGMDERIKMSKAMGLPVDVRRVKR